MKRKKNLGRDLHEQSKIYLGEISGQVWEKKTSLEGQTEEICIYLKCKGSDLSFQSRNKTYALGLLVWELISVLGWTRQMEKGVAAKD